MTEWLTPLQEMAHSQNCAIILVDHHKKPTGFDQDAIADILGSTAKGAMADTVLGLYRERGKAGAKLSITGRDVEEKTPRPDLGSPHRLLAAGRLRATSLTPQPQRPDRRPRDIGPPGVSEIADAVVGASAATSTNSSPSWSRMGVVRKVDRSWESGMRSGEPGNTRKPWNTRFRCAFPRFPTSRRNKWIQRRNQPDLRPAQPRRAGHRPQRTPVPAGGQVRVPSAAAPTASPSSRPPPAGAGTAATAAAIATTPPSTTSCSATPAPSPKPCAGSTSPRLSSRLREAGGGLPIHLPT